VPGSAIAYAAVKQNAAVTAIRAVFRIIKSPPDWLKPRRRVHNQRGAVLSLTDSGQFAVGIQRVKRQAVAISGVGVRYLLSLK
jgi:hypothetical protein